MDQEQPLTPYEKTQKGDIAWATQALRLSLADNIEVAATRDTSGFLQGENGNLPKFSQNLLKALLETEREIYSLEGDTVVSKKEFGRFGKLISFFSRLLYLDPEEKPDEEELSRYSISHKVGLYLPDSDRNLQEIQPPFSYDFRIPAIVEATVIHDRDVLTIGVMPLLYSHYSKASYLNGQSPDEVRQILTERGRLRKDGGMGKIVGIIEGSTIVEPFFYMNFESDGDRQITIKGSFTEKNGQAGILLKLPNLSDSRSLLFLPLDLEKKPRKFVDEILQFGANTPTAEQAFLLARLLLQTELKTTKDLKRVYKRRSHHRSPL